MVDGIHWQKTSYHDETADELYSDDS